MISLKIKLDGKLIKFDNDEKISVAISPDENNALSITDNVINITRGDDGEQGHVGGSSNLPGNGIDGDVDSVVEILRCNNTVSRISGGDPDTENEGVVLFGEDGLIKRIIDSLN
jgi:hypothetical protein